MRPCRGMGAVNPKKLPKAMRPAKTVKQKGGDLAVAIYSQGGQSRVNEAGNYTQPGMRKRLFEKIKAGGKGGSPGQWSARKAQMLAQQYKKSGGGYKD
jgi:hypothetical protein